MHLVFKDFLCVSTLILHLCSAQDVRNTSTEPFHSHTMVVDVLVVIESSTSIVVVRCEVRPVLRSPRYLDAFLPQTPHVQLQTDGGEDAEHEHGEDEDTRKPLQ